ncbi:hypothetical protein Tco_0851320 [Tanacetum coccineum]
MCRLFCGRCDAWTCCRHHKIITTSSYTRIGLGSTPSSLLSKYTLQTLALSLSRPLQCISPYAHIPNSSNVATVVITPGVAEESCSALKQTLIASMCKSRLTLKNRSPPSVSCSRKLVWILSLRMLSNASQEELDISRSRAEQNCSSVCQSYSYGDIVDDNLLLMGARACAKYAGQVCVELLGEIGDGDVGCQRGMSLPLHVYESWGMGSGSVVGDGDDGSDAVMKSLVTSLEYVGDDVVRFE